MMQAQIRLGTLPVAMILLQNGTLAMVRLTPDVGVIDQPEAGITAYFCNDGIIFTDGLGGSDDIDYNVAYDYKTKPYMLKWIQQQNIPNPFTEAG